MMENRITYEEYCERIRRLQAEMERLSLDVFFCYGTEGSYRNLCYLADYWPAFEEGGVLIGKEGLPLVLNGPESLEYAQTCVFGGSQVRQCRAFDHSEAPDINSGVILQSLEELLFEVTGGKKIRRLGLGDYRAIPYPLYQKLQKACGDEACLVDCDKVMEELRMNKSGQEIHLLEEACLLSERAFERAVKQILPEMTQYEMQGIFTAELFKEGGEGPGFAMGNFSGGMTRCSIGRNKHLQAGKKTLITVGMGARFGGYCGTYSRPFFFGEMPEKLKKEIDFMVQVHRKLAKEWLKPGITVGEVCALYERAFQKNGYGTPPGAPCHGIGIMEDEEPVFQKSSCMILKPGMTIALDNYFRTGEYGFRFEDAAVITKTGAKVFTERNWGPVEL